MKLDQSGDNKMEGKIKDVEIAIKLMKDDIKRANSSIQQVRSVFNDTETKFKMMENNVSTLEDILKHINVFAIESEQNIQKEIDAAFDKGKQWAIKELSDTITKDQNDARNEYNAALIKTKEDTIQELAFALTKVHVFNTNGKPDDTFTTSTQLSTAQVSEADCSTSFETICEELLRHTAGYLRTLNNEYRVEISNVSHMLNIYQPLQSFLFGNSTNEFGKSEAQNIINGLVFKEGTEIAPTTIIILQKAFRLLGAGQFSLEYRALLNFLTSCNAEFKELIATAGYMSDSQLIKLVQTALERQIMARGYLHGWEQKADAGRM
jgi:hypothetical protein